MSVLTVAEKGFSALDITGALLDGVGKELGLSEENMDVIKIGIGIVTANPVMVANGTMGLVGNLVEKNKTECAPPKKDANGQVCCKGYASTVSVSTAPKYGPAERFDMNSEAFAKWCPSDPYTKKLHDEYLLAKAGKHPNGCSAEQAKRALENQIKYSLDRNPAAKAEFEAYFQCQVVDPKVDQCGDIVVRPQLSSCPVSTGAITVDVGSQFAATGGNGSYGGGYYSNSPSMGSIVDKYGASQFAQMDRRINELKNGELTETDMLELQDLMAKKQRLFTLLSNLLSMENQMAMTAINNMKG